MAFDQCNLTSLLVTPKQDTQRQHVCTCLELAEMTLGAKKPRVTRTIAVMTLLSGKVKLGSEVTRYGTYRYLTLGAKP